MTKTEIVLIAILYLELFWIGWLQHRHAKEDEERLRRKAALASQPMQELGFLDQPPVSAIFDGSITERLSKTRQILEKKLASRPEVKP